MKRLISFILLAVFCMAVFACSSDKSTTGAAGTTGAAVTTGGTTSPSVKTTPKTYYSYGIEGFSVIKQDVDENGNPVRETLYQIDGEFGILAPAMSITASYGEDGKMISAEGKYLSLAVYATPQTKFTVAESQVALYDYAVSIGRNVQAYIKETRDENGNVTKTENFGRGGRLISTELTEYYENGERKTLHTVAAGGKTVCTCSFNEQGNFTFATVTEGDVTVTVTAEYYENGVIKSYTQKTAEGEGDKSPETLTVTFNEQGSVTQYKDFSVTYADDGVTPLESQKDFFCYSFDESGRVKTITEKNDTKVKYVTTYTYDSEGRLTDCVKKEGLRVQSRSTYTYENDGTYKQMVNGANDKKEKLISYNSLGNPVREESFEGDAVLAYIRYTYDSYGQLVKAEHFVSNISNGTATYSYNLHGDVTLEKLTGTFGNKNLAYQYFDNGELRLIIYRDSSNRIQTRIEYFEDGSVCQTVYSGDNYTAQTVNKNGTTVKYEVMKDGVKQAEAYGYYESGAVKVTELYVNDSLTKKTLYREDGKTLEVFSVDESGNRIGTNYEYYENGAVKSTFYYLNGSFAGGSEFLQDGNVGKTYTVDGQGVIYTSVYIRKDGVPTRIDTFVGDVFAEYTTLEYYSYVNDNENSVKLIRTYDTADTLVFEAEYAQIYLKSSGEYAHVLVREEYFEGGSIIAYFYAEYSEENGNIISSRTLLDGVRTETEYDTSENGRITSEKTYSGDVLVYVYESAEHPESAHATYASHFYTADGRLEYSIIYVPSSDNVPDYKFEYDESGNIKYKTHYRFYENEIFVSEYFEYDGNGNTVKEEKYSYINDKATNKELWIYDDDGNVLAHYAYKAGSLDEDWQIRTEEFFAYNDEGVIIKQIKNIYSAPDTFESKFLAEYNGKGLLTHKLSERYSSYANAVIEEIFITYDENDRITEQLTVHDSIISYRNVYEYYANGEKSLEIRYNNDNIISKTAYYENGNMKESHHYKDGQLTNEVYYREDGSRHEVYFYEDSQLVQKVVYSEKGNLQAVFQYRNGELVNETHYDENGNVKN